ncbi:MAG: glycoside hydrolase family 71 protein [Actinomycetota bacterium]|nr:glycoside hydrolase family 71 protein [Actinomycetota bacterium]
MLGVALALLAGAGVLALRDDADDAAAPGSATPALPFDLPPPAQLRASERKVFAHYFPPLPVSLDNRPASKDYYTEEYLDPDGEDGKHADYGGHLRDRPLPRPPRSGDDWRLQDMRSEVEQAVASGLDGFSVNIIQFEDGSDERLWKNTELLLQAAEDVDPGFQVMLMPDMSGSLVEKSVDDLADGVAELAEHASAYRLDDGRLVVAPFKAEAHDAEWWAAFKDDMESEHDLRVALLPVFVGDERRYLEEFDRVSYGMSVWGERNPQTNDPDETGGSSQRARAARVKRLGQKWMQPVSVQDARPNQGVYDEAENTQNLRDTWALARRTDADLVQLTTWNDYTEGTAFAPSVKHGWSFLDVSAYYLTWWKTGERPRVVRDAVYVTHRTQPVDAEPSDQEELMERRGGSPARDTVEALTFLTAPARVVVRVGDEERTCDVEAGVDTCTAPLSTGEVRVDVVRGDGRVASVTSPFEVSDSPEVQDLEYVAVGSLRSEA